MFNVQLFFFNICIQPFYFFKIQKKHNKIDKLLDSDLKINLGIIPFIE